ncbi:uncharacterized protein LOC121394457 [Xenopus laevis]|uniref:Uncharacterized protein LOC121394457 n=1 Tax=Xenopus laevis TaxID=8355 RepID=A0A8J1KW68_XENLA|nr:uncharacterized protein LOC121394457 [Xenopus laevis]
MLNFIFTFTDSTFNYADSTTSGYTTPPTETNTNAAMNQMQASHRRTMHSVLAVIVIFSLVYFVCYVIRRWKVPDAADEESQIEWGCSDSTYNYADSTTSGYTTPPIETNTNAAINHMQASHRRTMHSVLAVIVIFTLVYFVCYVIRRWKVPDAADEESQIEWGCSDSTYNYADSTTSGYTTPPIETNTNAAINHMQASHRRTMHSVLAVIVIFTLVYFVCYVIRRWKVPDAADEESQIERGCSGKYEPTIVIQYPEIPFDIKIPDMAYKVQQMISEAQEEPKNNEEPKQEDSTHNKDEEKNEQQQEKDKELSNGENAEVIETSANDDTEKKKRKWFARLKRKKEKIAGKTEKKKGKKNQNEEILASLLIERRTTPFTGDLKSLNA